MGEGRAKSAVADVFSPGKGTATVTDEEIRTFIDEHEWVFAKTMPQIPHWYTLRRKAKSEENFADFVQEIRLRGVVRPFGYFTPF
jgi:hypothetical protein